MANFTYSNELAHASAKKSKSKYKGGFKNGKNTSEYNHDYYMKNKEKWKRQRSEATEDPENSDETKKKSFADFAFNFLKEATKPNGIYIYDQGKKLYDLKKQASDFADKPKKGSGKQSSRTNVVPNKEESKKESKITEHTRKRNDSGKTATIKKRDTNKKEPYVSDEYKKELEYNSKKNEFPNPKNKNNASKSGTAKKQKNSDKEIKKHFSTPLGSISDAGNKIKTFISDLFDPEKQKERKLKKEAAKKQKKEQEMRKRGEFKEYSLIDRMTGKPERDNLKRAEEHYWRVRETEEQSNRAAAASRNKKYITERDRLKPIEKERGKGSGNTNLFNDRNNDFANNRKPYNKYENTRSNLTDNNAKRNTRAKARINLQKAQIEYNNHISTKIKNAAEYLFTDKGALQRYEAKRRKEKEERERKKEMKRRKRAIDRSYK